MNNTFDIRVQCRNLIRYHRAAHSRRDDIGQHDVVEKGYSILMKPFTMEQLERKVRAVLPDD